MAQIFSTVKTKSPSHNRFNLSYENKFSCKMGYLYPVFVQDVLPGDRFKVNTGQLVRLAPMLAPVMHRASIYIHYFFVPNRLVHDNWQDFITGGEDGLSTATLPLVSMRALGNLTLLPYLRKGTLWDFLDYPTISDSTSVVSVDTKVDFSFFRMYQLIYNEYYRDQNVTPEVKFSRGDVVPSSDFINLLTLRKRAWEKDYFTSSLPWAQRGAQVSLPLGGEAPVRMLKGSTPVGGLGSTTSSDGSANLGTMFLTNTGTIPSSAQVSASADLSSATATSINELRRAIRLQEWLEKSARGGSRYIEQIYSHFHVKSSDARLQRPEYLGGGRSSIQFSEVLQTSSTDSASPQANMAGHGVAAGNTFQFNRFFEEHGVIMGIMSIIPRTSYQQGGAKRVFRKDRFDFYWPSFAHLGEQPIFNKEVFTDFNSPSGTEFNERVFGYTPRYAEYRFNLSRVHGDMRSNLAFWHMGRIFSSAPALNSNFIESDPTTRIFAVTDQNVDNVYVDLYNQVKANRPIPKFGTPTI